jgi:hypothetical protein
VAVRLKTFFQILMAVLALGMGYPQSACAAGTPEAGKTCCCADNPGKCHSENPCKPSCAHVQVQVIIDKQLPARMALAPSPHGNTLLFSIAPTTVKYLVLVSVVHRGALNASPPFGGSPPQARLCLWLI